MTFPLMIHLNSTRIGLAPHLFISLISIEIFLHSLILFVAPMIVLAIARSTVIHQNVRLLNASFVVHYIVFVIARFIAIYYELNDLPVTKNDGFILAIDIIRDQFLGHFISQLGALSFERFVATHFWRWYERRGSSVVIVWIVIELVTNVASYVNVILCVNGYYDHEWNLVGFAVILAASFVFYLYAYLDNIKMLRYLRTRSDRYSLSHLFQVKENLRVLKFLLFFTITSIPFIIVAFACFLVFFYAPRSWDLERYLCMELFDFSCALYAPVYVVVGGRGIAEYRRQMYEIAAFKRVAKILGWQAPLRTAQVAELSTKETTTSYFSQLTESTSTAMTFPLLIHLNSTRIALAPNVFLPLIIIEISVHSVMLIMIPFVLLAIARSNMIHQNVRLLNGSLMVHHAIFALARFPVIYYELNDLPVTKSDIFILTIDILRDQYLGHTISQLGALSFERFIATHFWKWYERRGRSVVLVWLAIEVTINVVSMTNVLLCVNGYYHHEDNLNGFAVILAASYILYIYAYLDNLRTLRSLNKFSDQYSLSHLFQVKENLRVLKLLLIYTVASIPFLGVGFGSFLMFFYIPEDWELTRFICIELFDLTCALYAYAYVFVGGHCITEYRRQMYQISPFKEIAKLLGWEAPLKTGLVTEVSDREATDSYFGQLTTAWA